MGAVNLTVLQLSRAGMTTDYEDSLATDDTYYFPNNGRMFLHFKKSAAVDCTVTIQTPRTIGGLAVAERAVTVPASTGDRLFGPFTPSIYNDGDGKAAFTLSDIDGLAVAVISF